MASGPPWRWRSAQAAAADLAAVDGLAWWCRAPCLSAAPHCTRCGRVAPCLDLFSRFRIFVSSTPPTVSRWRTLRQLLLAARHRRTRREIQRLGSQLFYVFSTMFWDAVHIKSLRLFVTSLPYVCMTKTSS